MTTTLWVPWRDSAVYLDASALIKRYVDEDGTELVDELIVPEGPTIFVSWIAVIEALSNMERMVVDGRLTASEANDAARLLTTEMNTSHVLTCIVGPQTAERARQILRRSYQTPADSLHLATAVRLQEQHGWLPLVFVSSDERLVKAAQAEMLYVFNPAKPSTPAIRGVRQKFLRSDSTVGYSDE